MIGTTGSIPLLIAQAEEGQGSVSDIHLLLGGLVAIAVVAGIVGYLVIRKFRHTEDDSKDQAPFTLSQLRRMFEAGEVSLEEFEYMKESMISKVKAAVGVDEIKVDAASDTKHERESKTPTGKLSDTPGDEAATSEIPASAEGDTNGNEDHVTGSDVDADRDSDVQSSSSDEPADDNSNIDDDPPRVP